jgi:hypothetical protein
MSSGLASKVAVGGASKPLGELTVDEVDAHPPGGSLLP